MARVGVALRFNENKEKTEVRGKIPVVHGQNSLRLAKGLDLNQNMPNTSPASRMRASPRKLGYSIPSNVNVISPSSPVSVPDADTHGMDNFTSPDPKSKFHHSQRGRATISESDNDDGVIGPVDFGLDDNLIKVAPASVAVIEASTPSNSGVDRSHCFSPMPATPTEAQLISDLNKKMTAILNTPGVAFAFDDNGHAPGPEEGGLASPDVLSRFNNTAKFEQQQLQLQKEVEVSMTPVQHRGQQCQHGHHDNGDDVDESGHDFSPMPATPSTPGAFFESHEYSHAPIICGNGVSVESPDVLSKFSASGRPVMMEPVTPGAGYSGSAVDESGHDFSPMPATPSTPSTGSEGLTKPRSAAKGGMPVMYGNGVSVESPDVLSKFSASGRPVMMEPVTPESKQQQPLDHDFSPMPDTPVTPGQPAPQQLGLSAVSRGMGAAMPVIYGRGVSVESPDLLSKFNAQKRAVSFMSPVEESNNEHGFSPMPATPTDYLPEHAPHAGSTPTRDAVPVIHGQGVSIESPDVLSKFNSSAPLAAAFADAQQPSSGTRSSIATGQNAISHGGYNYPHTATAHATVPAAVHRRKFLRNQSYNNVSSSADSGLGYPGLAAAAAPPSRSRPSRGGSTGTGPSANKKPSEPVLDLFSETLSPLKENYSKLIDDIRGEVMATTNNNSNSANSTNRVQGLYSPSPAKKSRSSSKAHHPVGGRVSPLLKKQQQKQHVASPAPAVSTFAVMMNARTPSKNSGGGGGGGSNEDNEEDLFAKTLSPYKDDYAEIRERVNEMYSQEESEKSHQPQYPKPTPPVPRHAFAPVCPDSNSTAATDSSPKFVRNGRKLSPTSAGASSSTSSSWTEDKENAHPNVQVISFETGNTASAPPQQQHFRRSGRILRESASEPIILLSSSQTISSPPVSVEKEESTASSAAIAPSPSSIKELSPPPYVDSDLLLDHDEEEDALFSAIDRFENNNSASAASFPPAALDSGVDSEELRPIPLLDGSEVTEELCIIDGEVQVLDQDQPPTVKVTFIGSNLKAGDTLKKDKKKKKRQTKPRFGPFQSNLETLDEEQEDICHSFPLWIMPVTRFTKKAFPMQSVQVRVPIESAAASAYSSVEGLEEEEGAGAGADSAILASQDAFGVGRLRKKGGGKREKKQQQQQQHQDEEGEEKEEETHLFREDTYGTWMQAQMTKEVRLDDQNATNNSSSKFDAVFEAIECFDNSRLKELTKEGISLLDEQCKDRLHNTPLHAAVMVNNRKIVKLLLKHGANYDAVNVHGNTALHFSAEWQLASTTKYLLKKGASRDIRNSLEMLPGERVDLTQ
jgi:hypothetical protein